MGRRPRFQFLYLTDEWSISKRLGIEIPHPVRVFDLKGFGVDRERFLRELAPTFSVLALDLYVAKLAQVDFLKQRCPDAAGRLDTFLAYYYADQMTLESVLDLIQRLALHDRHEFDRIGMRGRRARSISSFILTRNPRNSGWDILRVPAQDFAQDVQDIRALKRRFQETFYTVSDHPLFIQWMRAVAHMVKELRPETTKLALTLHQVCIYADVLGEGNNSPEGTHQDGADYIVSALVVERAGILGGESVVYLREGERDTECLRVTLQPGQGLFQADKGTPLWHVVTPIREDPSVPPAYGSRSIFGFDINVIG